jgi:protein involved in polysaccharide export with SLBB domain
MLTNVTIFRGTQTLHANVYPILTNGIDNGDNILLEPNDMVVVPMNTAKIEVLGAVGGPGVYPLRPPGGNEGPMRMSDAISAAGGASREGARVHEVRLVREGADGKPVMTNYDYGKFMQFGDMSQNPILQDKDMIIIPDSRTKPSVGDVFNYYGLFSIFKAL